MPGSPIVFDLELADATSERWNFAPGECSSCIGGFTWRWQQPVCLLSTECSGGRPRLRRSMRKPPRSAFAPSRTGARCGAQTSMLPLLKPHPSRSNFGPSQKANPKSPNAKICCWQNHLGAHIPTSRLVIRWTFARISGEGRANCGFLPCAQRIFSKRASSVCRAVCESARGGSLRRA